MCLSLDRKRWHQPMSHGTFMVGSFHLSRLHTVPFEASQSAASLSICWSSLYASGGGQGPFSSHKKKNNKKSQDSLSSCFPQLTPRNRRSLQISPCTSQAESLRWQRQTGCCLKMWLMALPCALLGKPDTLLIDDPAHSKLLPCRVLFDSLFSRRGDISSPGCDTLQQRHSWPVHIFIRSCRFFSNIWWSDYAAVFLQFFALHDSELLEHCLSSAAQESFVKSVI